VWVQELQLVWQPQEAVEQVWLLEELQQVQVWATQEAVEQVWLLEELQQVLVLEQVQELQVP
jgi:hypothetical protein